jgi:hypothetical protein
VNTMRNFYLSCFVLLSVHGYGQNAEKYFKSFLEKMDSYDEYNVNYSSYQNNVFLDKGSIHKISDDHMVLLRSNGFAIQEQGLQLNVYDSEMTMILKKASENELNPLNAYNQSRHKLKLSFLDCTEKSNEITIRLEHGDLQGYAIIKINAKNNTLIEMELHAAVNGLETVILTKYDDWSFHKSDDMAGSQKIARFLDKIQDEYVPTKLLSEYDFINLINY